VLRAVTVTESAIQDGVCQICGHSTFVHDDVLWPELIHAWELSPAETASVNIQQGTRCASCGANVRSQALARALVHVMGGSGTLADRVEAATVRDLGLLEINEAGALTPWLSRLPRHTLARYPDCDITRLPFAEAAFDLVVHSDTLEHVSDPDQALRECRRVLVPSGSCVFTVPVIPGRLTRSRDGLSPSYHGHADCREPDFLVHTEFGADVWALVLHTGFASCQIVPFRYPSGLALIARKAIDG
jgi:SAM-dependent methyltransferase